MLSRMNGSLTRASSQRTATIKHGAMERMVRDMTPKHPASMDHKIHDWLTTNLGHVESLDRQARCRPGWDAVVNRDGADRESGEKGKRWSGRVELGGGVSI